MGRSSIIKKRHLLRQLRKQSSYIGQMLNDPEFYLKEHLWCKIRDDMSHQILMGVEPGKSGIITEPFIFPKP